MARPSVIVAPHFRSVREIFRSDALDELRSFAEVVWAHDEPMPQEEFDAAIGGAAAVVFGTWSYGNAIERAGEALQVVLEVAGGHDHPELGYETCFERGIELGSCAPAFGRAVAELGLGLTLAATRGISRADREFHAGREEWLHASNARVDTLFARTVGFVGCGGLSVELQALLDPFGVTILGYDPYIPTDVLGRRSVELADLATIFDRCDVVYVLATPAATTDGLVSRSLLERLQPHQTLVVLSRASLVDFDALTEFVLAGRFRAAIDVFPAEPLPSNHPIRRAEHAVLSAHRAGAVPDALLAIGDLVVNDLKAILLDEGERRMQYLTPDRLEALVRPPGSG